MEASIIIPTYNEEKDIFDCLESLKKQNFKNFEVIIVDDGSTDKTIMKINDFKKKNKKLRIKILKQNHRGPGAARNIGAKKSNGEILIFIDADMTFDKKYLENLVNPIKKNKKIMGTTHELEIVNNTQNIWSRCWGKVRVSKEDAKKVKIFRAIKKDKFLELGGFDPKYGYADDQSLWIKHKIRPVVAKNTICYHKNPETLKGVYNQSRWIGASSENVFLKIFVIRYLFVFSMGLFSLILIPILSIKKCYKNREGIIFPWMIVFMSMRYFGNLAGYLRRIYLKINYR